MSPKRILIAEDEAVSRLTLKARLERWGFEVIVAREGLEAWEILQSPAAPSLAIIDWMMPGLDGLELCRRLRARAAEPYVYVLLLTGKGRKEDLIEGLRAGADDYITKPVDAQELEVRVRGAQRIVTLQAELVASRQAMWFQATHDPLTSAWNRAAALDVLSREMERADREGTSFTIALADLDHFKRVNDTLGHVAGDAVLKQATERMSAALRPYDTLARYGGEEFLAILPGCAEEEGASVAERLRVAVSKEPMGFGDAWVPVTCSIGVATVRPGATVDELIRMADEALYEAKRAGRDRVVVGRPAAPPVLDKLAS